MTETNSQDTNTVDKLMSLFNFLFKDSYHTILVRGQDEPLYLPISATSPYHQIIFAHGSFSSALHEISHWCIAGKERRNLVDYGYWYVPDRQAEMQHAFLECEVAPQALELIFTLACGRRFFLSADNLSPGGSEPPPEWQIFKLNVLCKARLMLEGKMPPRALTLLPWLYRDFSSDYLCNENDQEAFFNSWKAFTMRGLVRLEVTLDL